MHRAPTPYVSSSITTTTTASVSMDTPLPSSDDSDLFYSFTDSPQLTSPPPPPPSQLTPAHPLQSTPSQSPLPRAQLFIGADEEYEEEEQQMQQQKQQQQQQGKQDERDSEMEMGDVAGVQSDRSQQSRDHKAETEIERKSTE